MNSLSQDLSRCHPGLPGAWHTALGTQEQSVQSRSQVQLAEMTANDWPHAEADRTFCQMTATPCSCALSFGLIATPWAPITVGPCLFLWQKDVNVNIFTVLTLISFFRKLKIYSMKYVYMCIHMYTYMYICIIKYGFCVQLLSFQIELRLDFVFN